MKILPDLICWIQPELASKMSQTAKMAIFTIKNKKLSDLKSKTFSTERELQELVDENLDQIFGLEFIVI